MAEEIKGEGVTPAETTDDAATSEAAKTRRGFVLTAAKVAVTVPAVGLLLSATTKPAAALISAYEASQNHILDDFTFGNNEEDVDAQNFHSNFNPFNGVANQDDHVPV
jgi:hypothetical protein